MTYLVVKRLLDVACTNLAKDIIVITCFRECFNEEKKMRFDCLLLFIRSIRGFFNLHISVESSNQMSLLE